MAVSGGGDSMALLAMLHRWSGARALRIRVATVDHGLRPEARTEAEQVAAFCRTRGISHDILETDDLTGPGNLSAKARDARYALLTAWAGQHALPVVLLGHTMDDQAETVLMRLARGSGAEGLSGMAPRRTHDGVTWTRPLLGLRRTDLRDWLRAEGIGWSEDPTNEDPAYDRIKARQALEVLEPLGLTVEGLSATADRLARQRRVLDNDAQALRARALTEGPLTAVSLDRTALANAERDTALRVLAELLQDIANAPYRPRFDAVERHLDWVLTPDGPGARTLAGCVILPRPSDDAFLVFRECAAQPGPAPASIGWDGWTSENAPDGSFLGALRDAGCTRLSQLLRDDVAPAPQWATAPRALRCSVPALYAGETADPNSLLAVPMAEYAVNSAYSGVKLTRNRAHRLRR